MTTVEEVPLVPAVLLEVQVMLLQLRQMLGLLLEQEPPLLDQPTQAAAKAIMAVDPVTMKIEALGEAPGIRLVITPALDVEGGSP